MSAPFCVGVETENSEQNGVVSGKSQRFVESAIF